MSKTLTSRLLPVAGALAAATAMSVAHYIIDRLLYML